jgi:hypothetical protein
MEGRRFSIGLRNSHDKSMRLAMTCGAPAGQEGRPDEKPNVERIILSGFRNNVHYPLKLCSIQSTIMLAGYVLPPQEVCVPRYQ